MQPLTRGAPDLRRLRAQAPLRSSSFVASETVADVLGTPIAELEQVPPIFAHHSVRALRRAPDLSAEELNRALIAAGDAFRSATLGGESPEEWIEAVQAASGLPPVVIRNALDKIAEGTARAAESVALGLPRGGAWVLKGAKAHGGGGQLRRRGEVLAVLAPGNGPGPHAIWPQALALGFKVALRPSNREPFTAARLVAALTAAGLGARVALLPGGYEVADALISSTDLTLAYGGDDLVRRHGKDPHVLVQGPGRSKLVIGRDAPRGAALETALASVAGLGGAACVCASAILVEEEPAEFARALHAHAMERFSTPEGHARWSPRFGAEQLELARRLHAEIPGALPFKAWDAEGGGSFVLPLLWHDPEPLRDQVAEWPLAAARIAPLGEDEALSRTLVLGVVSENAALIERLEALPKVSNFYAGPIPTTWMGCDVPHDGHLAEFLVSTRGYRQSLFCAG